MITPEELKEKIAHQIKEFGFTYQDGKYIPPPSDDKDTIRKLHSAQRNHILNLNAQWIWHYEDGLLDYFANGDDVVPEKIQPKLHLVNGGWQDILFKYAKFYWSVPLSQGMGKCMNYLVMDGSNNKIIGIFGLKDPIIGMEARENWIGWNGEQKRKNLWHILDAYILGAVPPYNNLLGAKLVASLITSNEVRQDFRNKYDRRPSISGKVRDGNLALVTTCTALGKSSILNRLKYKDRLLWQPAGQTKGFGHSHFHPILDDMKNYLQSINDLAFENQSQKIGEHSYRIINRTLRHLGFPPDELCQHGIKRGFYIAPLAQNCKEYLCDKTNDLEYFDTPTADIWDFFKERYLIPRSKRITDWKNYKKIRISDQLEERNPQLQLSDQPKAKENQLKLPTKELKPQNLQLEIPF